MSVVTGQYGAQLIYRNYNESYLGGVGNGLPVRRGSKLLLKSRFEIVCPLDNLAGKHPDSVLSYDYVEKGEDDFHYVWKIIPWSAQNGDADNTEAKKRTITYENPLGDGSNDENFWFDLQLDGNTRVPSYRYGEIYNTSAALFTQGNAVLFYPFWGDLPEILPWIEYSYGSSASAPGHIQTTTPTTDDEGRWIILVPLKFTYPGSASTTERDWGNTTDVTTWVMIAVFRSQRQHRIGNGLTFTFSRWMSPTNECYNIISAYRESLDNYVRSLAIEIKPTGIAV